MRVILKVIWKYFVGMMSRRIQEISSIFEFILFLLDDTETISMSTVAALIVTPIVGGAHYYISDVMNETAMVLNYLGCLGCAMFTIYNIEKAFVEFANLPHSSKSGLRSNVKKK